MAFLQFIFFLHLLEGAAAQLNSRSVLSSSSLSRLVVSRSTGDVFLADQDTVYLLPADLSEVTSNVSRTAGQTPEGMTLSKQEDKLIVCWAASLSGLLSSFQDAPCVVYNSTDLLQTLQTVGDNPIPFPAGAARGNPYLVSQGFVEDEGETFYVMSADSLYLYHREYRIPDGAEASETLPFFTIRDRRYVSGATVGNFSYFATSSVEGPARVVRVVRVCNTDQPIPNTAWNSWYEIQVICGAAEDTLAEYFSVLVSANFLLPSDGVEEPLLVVSTLTEKINSGSIVAALCTVPLSSIDASARNMSNYCATTNTQLCFPWMNIGQCDPTINITECNLSEGTSTALNTSFGECGALATSLNRGPTRLATPLHVPSEFATERNQATAPGFEPIWESQPFLLLESQLVNMSSSDVFVVDGVVVIFGGYSNGQVRKYATRHFSDMNTNPAPERTWSLSSKEVKALSHTTGSDFVYALTEDEVHRLPVEECSNFTDCITCITEGGLLCGWCSVENKCSRRPQCANSSSPDGLRWVQTTNKTGDRCLTVDIASGETAIYPRDTVNITVNISNLPNVLASDSEFFVCAFGKFGSGNLTALGGNIYSCHVPQIPLFQDELSQTINFTLRSSLHGVDFGLVQNGVLFYDCLAPESCSLCTSQFNCNWCPVEFQCRASGEDCSQLPVSNSTSCPRLLPDLTSDGRYYLHEGLGPQDGSLVLRGENLLMPTAGYSYRCVINSTGSELMVTVDANSSVTCQLPSGGIAITEAERVSRVDLQWGSSTNTFTIETSSMEQLIVLYNCGGLSGDDCSGCLGLSADYSCGYCRPDCNLNSLACGSNVIRGPDFQQCGALTVADTSPSAGTVEGDILFTIIGTNLGAYPRENISVLIGGKECEIDEERTISGASLVCVVPSAMAASSAGVTLSRSGESPQNISTFRYAEPVITSITPNKGTPTGNSTVVISGVDLDIGNTERTTVFTVPSSDDFNTLRRIFFAVRVLNSTAISGETSPLAENDSASFRFVVVNIDGTNVFGSVLFQYVVPRLTSVPECQIIKAGGVTVTINGVDLDAAVQPILTLLNESNAVGSGNCAVQSSSSISCRLPPLPESVGVGVQYSFSITFDLYTLNSSTDGLAQSYLETIDNPTLEPFDETYAYTSRRTISIAGTNLQHVPVSDYSVTVGGWTCTNLDVNEAGTAVTCVPPQSETIAGLDRLEVVVFIGDNLEKTVGVLHYEVNIVVVTVPVVVIVVIIIAAIVVFIICRVYKWFQRREKERKEGCRRRLYLEKAENDRLEQEVLNMQSQVTMIHRQMKEIVQGKQPQGGRNTYSEIDPTVERESDENPAVIEQNPAYIWSSEAPLSDIMISANEGADVTCSTSMDGVGMEGEEEEVRSSAEEDRTGGPDKEMTAGVALGEIGGGSNGERDGTNDTAPDAENSTAYTAYI